MGRLGVKPKMIIVWPAKGRARAVPVKNSP
jgi:hypothetical protein